MSYLKDSEHPNWDKDMEELWKSKKSPLAVAWALPGCGGDRVYVMPYENAEWLTENRGYIDEESEEGEWVLFTEEELEDNDGDESFWDVPGDFLYEVYDNYMDVPYPIIGYTG